MLELCRCPNIYGPDCMCISVGDFSVTLSEGYIITPVGGNK